MGAVILAAPGRVSEARRELLRGGCRRERAPLQFYSSLLHTKATWPLKVRHIAAWRHHVSIYPVPEVDGTLEQERAPCRASKRTLKFPLRAPVPYDLVGAVARAFDEERTACTS